MLNTFLIVMIITSIIIFGCIAYDSPTGASLAFVMFLFTSELIFKIPIWSTIITQPITVLGFFTLYICIGVGWSFPKWWFFVRKLRDEYVKELQSFLNSRGFSELTMPEELKQVWFSKEGRKWKEKIPPSAGDYKTKILSWMLYWPFSMTWTIIDEPFRKAFSRIFEGVRESYQKISNRIFSDLIEWCI